MAHSVSAKKRIRQNEKAKLRNKSYKSRMKTYVKKFITSLTQDDHTLAMETYKDAVKIIDRTATKGVIHKNSAARRKSRLSKKLNKLLNEHTNKKE
jgi:small subunit ribosomal protein S20